jgi:CheY-like chemotaxis protein
MPINVLYAEDNNLAREITLSLLSNYDINFSIAKDGLEALNLFLDSEDNEFDVILLDIVMPNMNGKEAAKKIRNSNHLNASNITIIALSANEDIVENEEVGKYFDMVLSKPVLPELLIDVLNGVKGEK